jgi:hypothetical protein
VKLKALRRKHLWLISKIVCVDSGGDSNRVQVLSCHALQCRYCKMYKVCLRELGITRRPRDGCLLKHSLRTTTTTTSTVRKVNLREKNINVSGLRGLKRRLISSLIKYNSSAEQKRYHLD